MGCLFFFLVTLTLATSTSLSETECGASLNSKNGVFSSQKHIFLQRTPCEWTITVPDNNVILLKTKEPEDFYEFFPSDTHRFLVYDVQLDGQLIFREDWSYKQKPSSFTSSTSTILIRFLRYKTLDEPYAVSFTWSSVETECGGSFKSTNGVITSPSPIYRNMVCEWTITVPGDYRIQLIRNDPSGTYEAIPAYTNSFEVYEVHPNKTRSLVSTWSLNENPSPLASSTSTLNVVFRAFEEIDAQFSLSWSIVIPAVSSIRDCPNGTHVKDGYIKEGTTATCQCYLTDKGDPQGCPLWMDATGVSVGVDNNNYTASLTLRYNPDDPNPSYKCKGSSSLANGPEIVFAPKFAYGPNEVNLIGHDAPLMFNNSITTFEVECEVLSTNTNPAPLISLDGADVNSIALVQGFSTSFSYRHLFKVSCKAGVLIGLECVASNSVFPELSVTKGMSMLIPAPPSSHPIMSVIDNGTALITNSNHTVTSGQKVVVKCRVDGGHPPVIKVTIICGGHQITSNGQKTTLVLEINKDMHQTKCVCSADHVTKYYFKTTEFTLLVKYAPKMTDFTVNYQSQSLEVVDGDKVTFYCKAEGYPTPMLFLRGRRSDERLYFKHVVSGDNRLTGEITKVMSCSDADVYTCNADNDVGGLVNKSRSVFVRCTPQLQFFKEDEKVIEFTSSFRSSMKIEIFILGFPKPYDYTLTKVGNQSSQYKTDLMKVELLKGADYSVTYKPGNLPLGTVVVWILDLVEGDSGQFIINIDNGIGDGLDYRFNVNLTPEPSPLQEDLDSQAESNTDFIIGVSAAFVLIFGVVMVMLGMRIEKRCNKARKDVVMLQPSPSYEDNSVSLLQEAYADITDQSLRASRRLESQYYHEYETVESHRCANDYADVYDGYLEVLDPLSNDLYQQKTGEIVPCQTPDFQNTTAPQLLDAIRGSGHQFHEYERLSDNSNVESSQVIDQLSNLFEQRTEEIVPFHSPDFRDTTVPPLLDAIRGLNESQRDQFHGYETSSNESNYEYLDVIDPPLNLDKEHPREVFPTQAGDKEHPRGVFPTQAGDKEHLREVFPTQAGDKNETRDSQFMDDDADENDDQSGNSRQRQLFQDYERLESDTSLYVEANELVLNPTPHNVLSYQSSVDHEYTSVDLLQEIPIGNVQACQQDNQSQVTYYEDPDTL